MPIASGFYGERMSATWLVAVVILAVLVLLSLSRARHWAYVVWGVLFSAAFPIAHFDTGRRLFAHELTPRRPFRKRSGSVRTRRELRAVRANANDAYVDALVDRVCVVTPSDVVAKYEAANRPRAEGR